jgi:hypothetical protein
MEQQDHDPHTLDLEERKFKFEQEKYASDNSIMRKNFATIITAIISITAVSISLVQVFKSDLSKKRELEILQVQGDKQIELQRAQKDREHSIELAKFIAANQEVINGNDNKKRELMKDVILVAYPRFAEDVFKRLEHTSTDTASKEVWKTAQTEAAKVSRDNMILTYYASAISQDVFRTTKELLKQEGYPNIEAQSQLYRESPKWFEKSCTVIYYDDGNLALATDLAAKLKTKIGCDFRIVKGTVFSEIRGQDSNRIFVHQVPCSN